MYLTLELWNIVPHSTSRNRRFHFVRPASIVSLTLGPARHLDSRAGPQDLGPTSLPSFANLPPGLASRSQTCVRSQSPDVVPSQSAPSPRQIGHAVRQRHGE